MIYVSSAPIRFKNCAFPVHSTIEGKLAAAAARLSGAHIR